MKNIIYLIMGVMVVVLALSFSVNTAVTGDTMGADKYTKVLIDNDIVRVLEINRPPGTIVPMHTHPPYIAYFFNDCIIKHTFPNGKTKVVKPTAGKAAWKPKGATHAHEIMGTNNKHLLVIELKK